MASSTQEAWEAYVAAERRGVRQQFLAALQTFLTAWEALDPESRDEWAENFLRRRFEENEDLPLRAPLFERVVLPYLFAQYNSGSAQAAVRLAELRQSGLGSHGAWQRFGDLTDFGLLREAYRRNPSAEWARQPLVRRMLRYLGHTLHEIPAGVLWGMDGASVEQCLELLDFLQELKGLMTEAELENYAELLSKADLHYRAYREFLMQQSADDYASFVRRWPKSES